MIAYIYAYMKIIWSDDGKFDSVCFFLIVIESVEWPESSAKGSLVLRIIMPLTSLTGVFIDLFLLPERFLVTGSPRSLDIVWNAASVSFLFVSFLSDCLWSFSFSFVIVIFRTGLMPPVTSSVMLTANQNMWVKCTFLFTTPCHETNSFYLGKVCCRLWSVARGHPFQQFLLLSLREYHLWPSFPHSLILRLYLCIQNATAGNTRGRHLYCVLGCSSAVSYFVERVKSK